jgi:hypothetical protein
MLHTCVAACRSSSIINCGSIINELRRAVRRVPIARSSFGALRPILEIDYLPLQQRQDASAEAGSSALSALSRSKQHALAGR